MTTFEIGNFVQATSNVQGLNTEAFYKVVGVQVQPTPFGTFVTYELREYMGESDDADFGAVPEGYAGPQEVLGVESFFINNGHLVLREAEVELL